jgi:hypothetical protein
VTADAHVDVDFLERRLRLALHCATTALLVALVSFPLGMAIGHSKDADAIGGAFLLAGIVGVIAAPWIVRAWQSFMRRQMVAAAVADHPDIRHIDSEQDRSASEAALSSPAFTLGAFRDSGLIETFESATAQHVLTGDAQGVPFAIAEVVLLDDKSYQMFGGVLASFRLARPCHGLTIVARDHGLLGNLLARVGSSIQQLPLEDPEFEGIFEVYGDDQVGGRVVLTTVMLERLKALDELAHAHGFACAFRGEHLLIAFKGMTWRCPAWRILQPIDSWLRSYAQWLTGLVELPRDIVKTLNITASSDDVASSASETAEPGVAMDAGPAQVFSSGLWRLVGEGGMSLAYAASGALFGGVALFGAWYGITQGYSKNLFWYFWGMIAAGVVYGIYAVSLGVRQLALLAWRWNSPLRTLRRP